MYKTIRAINIIIRAYHPPATKTWSSMSDAMSSSKQRRTQLTTPMMTIIPMMMKEATRIRINRRSSSSLEKQNVSTSQFFQSLTNHILPILKVIEGKNQAIFVCAIFSDLKLFIFSQIRQVGGELCVQKYFTLTKVRERKNH